MDSPNEATRILSAIEQGDPHAAAQLLPLVYDELRKLASQQLANEMPGQTLQPTALVHEAYVRLVGVEDAKSWENRRHFFGAAAKAMRDILVDAARRKRSDKHGGSLVRVELDEKLLAADAKCYDLLDIDEALKQLALVNPDAAKVVELRFFAAMTGEEAAAALGMSPRSVDNLWQYAKAWLLKKLQPNET